MKVTSYHCLFFVACILSGCSRDVRSVIQEAQGAVVSIATYDSAGYSRVERSVGTGTGFFVGHNMVVTCWHVMEWAERASIKVQSGAEYTMVEVLDEDSVNDLILLGIRTDDVPPVLSIEGEEPEEGDKIMVVGNPFGLERSVSEGIVAAIRGLPPYDRIIQITAPVSPGSSGSPVLNMRGKVVGVVSMSLKTGQNLNFAIPSSTLAQLDIQGTPVSLHQWTLRHQVATNKESRPYWEEGDRLYKAGNFEGALSMFEECSRLGPRDVGSLHFVARCQEQLGSLSDAIIGYQKVLALETSTSDSASTLASLGRIYFMIGRRSDGLSIRRWLAAKGYAGLVYELSKF